MFLVSLIPGLPLHIGLVFTASDIALVKLLTRQALPQAFQWVGSCFEVSKVHARPRLSLPTDQKG